MTITKTAEQIVNEVENCNRFGDDMHERDKLIAIEIVSKLLTIRDAKVREEEKKRIIKEYGRSFNDGCGCCMFESLEEALKKEAK